jgi:hypothetical protein
MLVILPATSIALFALLWWAGELDRPLVVGACVLIGVAGQFLAPVFSLACFVAALLNVGVAMYLVMRLKLI